MRQFKVIFLTLVASLLSISTALPVQAANGADWRAGNIIDDAIFYNKNAMNVTSIQAFLDAKVPTCDNWGTQSYAGTTRAAYSQSHGQTLPLICLKQYYENPTTHENNLQGRPIPAGALSAAQIISAASQDYGINPQVLITLIQKEQGLITDDWPWENQYRSATGYGCPDTNVCNSQYYGFYNQVYNAARQFRIYANNPNSFNHVAGTNNTVRLSPNASCGAVTVFIQNQATASLYNYTPYTPNQAALSNLYGTGDSCSSYGNRNFWRFFIDWFGALYANYSWSTVAQGAYYDSNKQLPVNLGTLGPNQRYYLTITVRNNGNITWRNSDNPVILATYSPQDRASQFCDSTWLNTTSCNRVTMLREGDVPPGQYGTFEFWVTTPSNPGNFNEIYTLVMAGMSWMNGSSVSFPMIVNQASYLGSITGQYAYTDAGRQTAVDINHLVPGHRYYLVVTAKNRGNIAWQNSGSNPTNLGTLNARDRMSPFCDASTWLACNRPAPLHENTILPGQVGSFEFWISPPRPGMFTETFQPVVEGKTWLDDAPATFKLRVEPYIWWTNSVRMFTDSSKTTQVNMNNLDPDHRYYVSINIHNIGWAPWQRSGDAPFTLATAGPQGRVSTMCDGTWLGCSRPATISENTVAGGYAGTFEFWLNTPRTAGDYTESFTPILAGSTPTWLGGDTIDVTMRVTQPRYTWDLISQGAYTDSSKTTPVNMGNLQAGHRYYLTTTVKNTGNVTWRQPDSTPMRLGAANPLDRTSPFCDSTWPSCVRPAALHENNVPAGQYGSFEFWITAPSTPGAYNEIYAPVVEQVTWLDTHTISFPAYVR